MLGMPLYLKIYKHYIIIITQWPYATLCCFDRTPIKFDPYGVKLRGHVTPYGVTWN